MILHATLKKKISCSCLRELFQSISFSYLKILSKHKSMAIVIPVMNRRSEFFSEIFMFEFDYFCGYFSV